MIIIVIFCHCCFNEFKYI